MITQRQGCRRDMNWDGYKESLTAATSLQKCKTD